MPSNDSRAETRTTIETVVGKLLSDARTGPVLRIVAGLDRARAADRLEARRQVADLVRQGGVLGAAIECALVRLRLDHFRAAILRELADEGDGADRD